MSTHYILGASDPEMQEIETVLRASGADVHYATVAGVRVHPGNAYKADGVNPPLPAGIIPVIRVECDGPGIPAGAVVIDHHRPGDPGFGRPPAEFLGASSIGQVVAHLDVDWWYADAAHREVGSYQGKRLRGSHDYWHDIAAPDHCLVAAADHCLRAAYRGECPGVDPDALMAWRAASRAAFQGRPVEDILADIERATEALFEAQQIALVGPEIPLCGPGWADDHDPACPSARGGVRIADMRRDTPIPELPEAACRLGIGYISGPLVGPDGHKKFTCSGSPESISAFMETWAPAQGLRDIYGDPARGFAGGYAS